MSLVPVMATLGAQRKVSMRRNFRRVFWVDSGKPGSHKRVRPCLLGCLGECPERQRGRTVNPLAKPS